MGQTQLVYKVGWGYNGVYICENLKRAKGFFFFSSLGFFYYHYGFSINIKNG